MNIQWELNKCLTHVSLSTISLQSYTT